VLVEASRLPYRDVTKEETPSEMPNMNSPLFELARVFVRVDHVARCIVNTNHSIM
jgi:hypothetical protein